ncbi:MAG TPA: LysM peptidoglycan-binding domain-containing protein [Candidatus Hydrogenedentes bacterium]|nr:LysM peptidoglycan-binding domain-containing protein [Candidatus Hydrogenedentota bacterium]
MLGGLLLLALAVSVEVDLAPDQPLHFVYVDDPLIVELRSDTDVEATVQLTARRADRDTGTTAAVGPVRLPAHGVYWWAAPDLPAERGFYAVDILVETPSGPVEARQHFCRVDRGGALSLPLWAQADTADPHELLALKSIGVNALRLDASQADFVEQAAAAIAQGLGVIAAVDTQAVPDAAEFFKQSGAITPVRWEVRAPSAEALAAFADALRKAGSAAPIAAVVRADNAASLLSPNTAVHIREMVVDGGAASWEQVQEITYAARRTGHERWRLHAAPSGPEPLPLAFELLAHMAVGYSGVGFAIERAYNGRPGEDFAALSGLASELEARDPVGPLSLAQGVQGLVFRNCDRWLIVLRADRDAEVRVPVGAARDLRLLDTYHNDLPVPAIKDGHVAIALATQPVYLRGSGGIVISAAARNHVVRQARAFAARPAFKERLPQPLMQRIGEIAAEKKDATGRANFLFLLRAFPYIEEAWHDGGLPKDVAAPALGGLADLLRTLSILQEDTKEPFVAPLANQLEKCAEYRALYLTGSEARERGEWLLEEVLRLMNEAEALADAGRAIEANAVASIAEWRARTLDYAAKAPPLVEPTAEHLPEAPATPDILPAAPSTPEPSPRAPEPPPAPEMVTHKVAAGENPSVIADKYGVTTDDLLRWNNLTRRSTLRIGDELIVYLSGAPEAPPSPAMEEVAPAGPAKKEPRKITHTVQRGDNPSVIANKYGVSTDDFLKWNNLTKRSVLHIGEKYVVYVEEKSR